MRVDREVPNLLTYPLPFVGAAASCVESTGYRHRRAGLRDQFAGPVAGGFSEADRPVWIRALVPLNRGVGGFVHDPVYRALGNVHFDGAACLHDVATWRRSVATNRGIAQNRTNRGCIIDPRFVRFPGFPIE